MPGQARRRGLSALRAPPGCTWRDLLVPADPVRAIVPPGQRRGGQAGAGSACLPVAAGGRRDGLGLEDVDVAHGPVDRAATLLHPHYRWVSGRLLPGRTPETRPRTTRYQTSQLPGDYETEDTLRRQAGQTPTPVTSLQASCTHLLCRAADLALILLRTAATIERSSGTPVAEPEITAIAVAQAVVAIQVIGGATVSIWFPGLAMLSRQGLLWCAYWRLHLLWATLRHAVPQIELPRQPGTRFQLCYRLHRRVIEIQDAQLILKPYWRSDISDQAAAAARSARLTPERRRAVVEAAVIVTALDTWQQDTPARYGGTSPEHASAALSNNLRAEATHLILVSQAMRHSRIVQHLTHTPLREIGPKRWAAHPPVRLTARRWGLAAGAAPHAGQRPPPLAWLDAVLTVLSPCVRALLQFAYARVVYAHSER